MIPPLVPETGLLPFQGVEPYQASLDEIREGFVDGTNQRREQIWHMFELWLQEFQQECIAQDVRNIRIYMSGSFVSGKPLPNDIDILVAFARPYDNEAMAQLLRARAHFWTLQAVTAKGDNGVISRVQPALGLVDAHRTPYTVGRMAQWENDWTTEYGANGRPAGLRKGWLEVNDV